MEFDPLFQLEKARQKLQTTAVKCLKSQIAFHKTMAKSHSTSADDFEKDSSEHLHHTTAAAAHAQAGSDCMQCLDECSKADWGNLGKADGAVPDRVSAVATAPPGITAVPRAGQRAITQPEVPEQFAKLVEIEE